MIYEEQLASLVAKYVHGHTWQNPGIEPLTQALGCMTCVYVDDGWSLVDPPQPPEGSEAVVRNALSLAMRIPNVAFGKDCSSTFAVLDGLSKKQRWRMCLQNTDDAFTLATMLISYVCQRRNENLAYSVRQHRNAIEDSVLAIINEWAKPNDDFGCFSSREQLAHLLFGDVWCDLFLLGEKLDQYQFMDRIASLHPPIRLDLLPPELHPGIEVLPVLE
jgi:hypothetical protein